MSQTKAQLLNPLGDLDLSGQLTGVGATFTGNIRAVDGIFSGNVSVAGTLTKEDVTNVDSVGLITARSGINVTGGNVGIGTNAPTNFNAAADNLVVGGGAGHHGMTIWSAADGDGWLVFNDGVNTTLTGAVQYNHVSDYMAFRTDTTEKLRINSSGQTLINTTSANDGAVMLGVKNPTATDTVLDVVCGSTSHGSHVAFSDDAYARGIISYNHANNFLAFRTNGVATDRLHITAAGKVGINTTSPGSPLEVNGGSALDTATFNSHHAQGVLINLQRSGTNIGFLGSGKNIADATGGVDDIGLRSQANLIFTSGGGTERLRIDSDGKLLIGINASTSNDSLIQSFKPSGNDSTITVGNVATSASGLCRLDFAPSNSTIGARIECHATEDFASVANRTADLVFITRKDGVNSEKLRIGSGGEIGIAGANYGTAGQVIVSGGSGAAVAWADAGGAPEIEGTVSGSISSGDAVIVKTDGNIEKVTETITATNNPGNAGNSGIVNQNDTNVTKMIWCKGTDRLIALYCLSNDQIMIRIGVISSSGITWTPSGLQGHQGLDTYWGMSLSGKAMYDMAWDEDAQQLLIVCGHRDYNYIQGRFYTVSDTAISATTSRFTIWTGSSSGIRIRENCVTVKKLGNRKFIAGWVASGADMYGKMRVIELNSDGNNYTQGTLSELPTGTSPDERLVSINFGDPNAAGDIPLTFLKYNSNNGNKLYARACTISGTTISYGSEVLLSGSASARQVYAETSNYTIWPSISFDEDNDVYLVNYRERYGTNDNRFFCRCFKCTGTTLSTVGSEKQLTSNTPQNLNVGTYDPVYNKHIVWVTDNYGYLKYFVVTTTTTGTPTSTSETATSTNVAETYTFPFVGATSFDSEYNRQIVLGTVGTGGGQMYRWIFGPFATSSTNMTAENFIGFSDAAYTNGQTGKVLTVGNQTTKSGLTPGKKYYVQKDGSVKTSAASPSVQAGTSILSTKLLINF